jgi:hypothetical protein
MFRDYDHYISRDAAQPSDGSSVEFDDFADTDFTAFANDFERRSDLDTNVHG